MRISDWSSDVCSSDLAEARGRGAGRMSRAQPAAAWPIYRRLTAFAKKYRGLLLLALVGMVIEAAAGGAFTKLMQPIVDETFVVKDARRSEEHTSELQSLMRISYAVFCLKTKK